MRRKSFYKLISDAMRLIFCIIKIHFHEYFIILMIRLKSNFSLHKKSIKKHESKNISMLAHSIARLLHSTDTLITEIS